MPRKKLTARTIITAKAAPAGTRIVLWDMTTPGLGLKITDKRSRSFLVYRRRPGHKQPTRFTLGKANTDDLTVAGRLLAQARERARIALADLAQGAHPKEREHERATEE